MEQHQSRLHRTSLGSQAICLSKVSHNHRIKFLLSSHHQCARGPSDDPRSQGNINPSHFPQPSSIEVLRLDLAALKGSHSQGKGSTMKVLRVYDTIFEQPVVLAASTAKIYSTLQDQIPQWSIMLEKSFHSPL